MLVAIAYNRDYQLIVYLVHPNAKKQLPKAKMAGNCFFMLKILHDKSHAGFFAYYFLKTNLAIHSQRGVCGNISTF